MKKHATCAYCFTTNRKKTMIFRWWRWWCGETFQFKWDTDLRARIEYDLAETNERQEEENERLMRLWLEETANANRTQIPASA